MISLDITLEGDKLMSRALMVSADRLKDFTKPLTESAQLLQKSFQLNFDAQGAMFGGWAPRKPQMRHGARVDTWPLLEKTGTMRGSFYSDVAADTAVLGNNSPYFKYHQSNAARTKLPRRVMMDINDANKVLIQKTFQQYLIDSTAELR